MIAVEGIPKLYPGESVEFEWQDLGEIVQGFRFHAQRVWPSGSNPVIRDSGMGSFNGSLRSEVLADNEVAKDNLDKTDENSQVGEDLSVTGVVLAWHTSDGWGVVETTQGDVAWAHFSGIQDEGFRALNARERVNFLLEPLNGRLQDGYSFRTHEIRKV